MKCRLFLALVASFLVFSATFALGAGIVYASGISGGIGGVFGGGGGGGGGGGSVSGSIGNAQSDKTANAVASDPYTSGCSKGAYLAISGPIKDASGNTLATVENWYSPSCVKNWARIVWSSGTNLQTFIKIYAPNNEDPAQCYPTECQGYYPGGLSPSWTDMINGQKLACAYGAVKTPSGKPYDTDSLKYGLCA